MKKLLTALLVIVVAIIVIAPKMMGSQYQEQLTNVVTAINATPPYHAKVISTEDGWFGSTTTLQIEVDLAKVDPEFAKEFAQDKLKSDIVIHAHYGPLIFNDGMNLALFSVDAQIQGDDLRKTLTWDKNAPLFKLSGTQSLTGKLTFHDEIAPFTAVTPSSKSNVSFSGYQGNGSWVNNHLTYESKLDDASIKDVSTMEVKGLTTKLNFDGTIDDLIKGGLSNSDMTIAMKELNIEPLFNAQGLIVTLNSQLDKASQVGSVGIKTDIANMSYQDETASDLSFDIALSRLNNVFFTDYAAFNQQLNQADEANKPAALADFLHKHTVQFFKTMPELVIKDAHGTLPEGKFNLQFDGRLNNTDDKTTLDQLSQPTYWLSNANMNAAMNADKALVQAIAHLAIEEQLASDPDINTLTTKEYNQLVSNQANVLIKQAMDQGAIVIKDGMYRIQLGVKDGKALLNGKPSALLDAQF